MILRVGLMIFVFRVHVLFKQRDKFEGGLSFTLLKINMLFSLLPSLDPILGIVTRKYGCLCSQSLPKTRNLSCAKYFIVCNILGTRHIGSLPCAAKKEHGKAKAHGRKSSLSCAQK